MSYNSYIGIDPGKSGAMAMIIIPDNDNEEIHFIDHSEQGVKERYQWLYDANIELVVRKAVLESVHSLPGMSAKSNFTFGGEFYTSKALLELQDFGYDLVQPKDWQKVVGIPAKKKGVKRTSAELKKLVAERATQIYPQAQLYTPRGRLLDGRSDALMIAHYCRLTYG